MKRLSSAMRSVVECPVCMEVKTGKLFQCANGHIICADCRTGKKTSQDAMTSDRGNDAMGGNVALVLFIKCQK